MSEMKFKLDWIALNVVVMAIQSLFTICKSNDLMTHGSCDMGHLVSGDKYPIVLKIMLLLINNKIIKQNLNQVCLFKSLELIAFNFQSSVHS